MTDEQSSSTNRQSVQTSQFSTDSINAVFQKKGKDLILMPIKNIIIINYILPGCSNIFRLAFVNILYRYMQYRLFGATDSIVVLQPLIDLCTIVYSQALMDASRETLFSFIQNRQKNAAKAFFACVLINYYVIGLLISIVLILTVGYPCGGNGQKQLSLVVLFQDKFKLIFPLIIICTLFLHAQQYKIDQLKCFSIYITNINIFQQFPLPPRRVQQILQKKVYQLTYQNLRRQLESIAFYNEEIAIRMLKQVTTIVISHGHFYYCHVSCVHGETQGQTKNHYKNKCQHHVGFDNMSEAGYFDHRGRYSRIQYVLGQDSQNCHFVATPQLHMAIIKQLSQII
ncbi:Hypothetical_protein [Hexamita inflata]|uniref:Hypothetical_protein n=1 Tax=Hexamita inflata TaxID=28002 RepID=A0ABP1H731_9EUKA